MLFTVLLFFELVVKIASLQLVVWASYYLSREYLKAVVEVASECVTIVESFYATRAVVPTRV